MSKQGSKESPTVFTNVCFSFVAYIVWFKDVLSVHVGKHSIQEMQTWSTGDCAGWPLLARRPGPEIGAVGIGRCDESTHFSLVVFKECLASLGQLRDSPEKMSRPRWFFELPGVDIQQMVLTSPVLSFCDLADAVHRCHATHA